MSERGSRGWDLNALRLDASANIHNIVIYIALNRTPNMDCYWLGAVPNLYPKPPAGLAQHPTWYTPLTNSASDDDIQRLLYQLGPMHSYDM